MKVFIDNCIISVSDTMVGVRKKRNHADWGEIEMVGYVRAPLPPENQSWKRRQVQCLPTIGRLAREKRIRPASYIETMFEGWKRSGSFPKSRIGNIFDGIEIEQLDAAVERSYFATSELSYHIQPKAIVEFCGWLNNLREDSLNELIAAKPTFPSEMANNLRNISRFKDICQGLGKKQYPDAFHFWTAEVHNCDVFLTIDGKFIRAMTETKKLQSTCKLMSPCELLDLLGVLERDPFRYAEGVFYDIFGTPC